MAYLHGTYGAFDKSIGLVPVATDTIPVYVGVAPVNLVRGYEEMGNVNGPLQVKKHGRRPAFVWLFRGLGIFFTV